MKTSVISDRVWNNHQSWYREVIERVGDNKVRYTVRVNAYDFQSYAHAEAWLNGEWSKVHQIPGPELKTGISYVEKDVDPKRFDKVLAELRSVTKAVLA